jgi:hypothetical protein
VRWWRWVDRWLPNGLGWIPAWRAIGWRWVRLLGIRERGEAGRTWWRRELLAAPCWSRGLETPTLSLKELQGELCSCVSAVTTARGLLWLRLCLRRLLSLQWGLLLSWLRWLLWRGWR